MDDDEPRIDELLAHREWLERLAERIVRDPHAAADAVQSTWLSAIRRPPGRAVRVRAWLRVVLFNEVRQAKRKQDRRRLHETLAEPSAPATTPSDNAIDELRTELLEILAKLDEPYRTVLGLHFFEELSSPEISTRVGVPAATVRAQVMRGLQRLRTELARRHKDTPLEVLLLPLLTRGGDARTAASSLPFEESVARRASWLANPLTHVAAVLLVAVGWLLVRDTSEAPPAAELIAEAESVPVESPLDSAPLTADRRALPMSAPDATPAVDTPPESTARVVLDVEVVDAFGARRGDASVLVFRREGAAFAEAARTDSFGAAHVAVDPIDVGAWGGKGASGRVAIRASADGWACSDVVLASTARGARTLRLVLPARETILSGQVVDEASRPVAGADVELGYAQANQLSGVADADPSLPQPVGAVSDENGRFVAHGIDGSRGRVPVLASRAGFVPTFVEQIVDGAAERACTIVLTAGGRVHGVVRDANGDPVPAALVWHEPVENGGDAAFRSVGYVARVRGWCSSTLADANGSFELAAIAPGSRLLWAQDPAKPDEVAHASVLVSSGTSVAWNPELDTREPVRVVLDTGTRAREGWIVRLFFDGPNGRCIREGQTDAAGAASFFDVCANAVDVSVFAADTGFLAARTRIDRGKGGATHIVLDEPAVIAGRVVDASGAPLQDAILRLVPKDGVAPWTQLSYEAESGSFEHTLPASPFLLVASLGGSNVRIAEFELAAGMRVELGTLRLPALANLRLAHGASPAISGLEYRIVQLGPALPPSVNMRVEVGAWPPPAERELLPGEYVIEIGSFLAKEVRVDRSVAVTLQAGGDVTLQLSR